MSLNFNISKSESFCSDVFHYIHKNEIKSLTQKYPHHKDLIMNEVESNNFEGSYNESLTFNLVLDEQNTRITILGLGDKKELSNEKIFRISSSITYKLTLIKKKISSIDISLPSSFTKNDCENVLLGLSNGHYAFDKYKTKKANLDDLSINIVFGSVKSNVFESIVRRVRGVSKGVNMTRDLVNEQPFILTPQKMADYSKQISKNKNISCKILDHNQLRKKGMLGIWDVGKGSSNLPRFIHLIYKGKTTKKKVRKVAIIGKGMTYDSGGLSIKPADFMLTMKMDMAGAGCVLGVFESLGALQPDNIEVHGIVPTAENMLGPNAYKPDDIVNGLSGKTIEVINTDAEGRVILSDAIEYTNKLGVDEMIDLATLTGACMVALGNFTAGLFSNTQKQADKILKMSNEAGEKIWQLPLDEDLRPSIDSNIADIKNSASTRYGGATTAAMFLQFFVDKNIPWSHIDIAGPAYIDSKRNWLAPGATGFGVMTLIKYLGF